MVGQRQSLATVCALLLGLTACQIQIESESSRQMTHFDSPTFSLDYPSSWEQTTAAPDGEKDVRQDLGFGELLAPSILQGIEIQEIDPPQDLFNSADELIDSYANAVGAKTRTSFRRTTLSGQAAAQYDAELSAAGMSLKRRVVVTFFEGRIFELTCQAEASRFERVWDDCAKVIASFTLKKRPGP